MIVRGEDDIRDPPVSWQYASKCLLISTQKMIFPNGFLTLGPRPLSTQSINERIAQRAADTRDPAAHPVLFVFEMKAWCQLGCAGHSGLSSQPFLLCLPQDQPSSFFLSENGQPGSIFLGNTQPRPSCFSQPYWAANLSRQEGMYSASPKKWAISSKKCAVNF